MTGPTSRVRESRRLQVGDMPEATGPLSLRPHGANPEATFSCLPASTEVTALEKKKAFLPDTAVASRAERNAPAPQRLAWITIERRRAFPAPRKHDPESGPPGLAAGPAPAGGPAVSQQGFGAPGPCHPRHPSATSQRAVFVTRRVCGNRKTVCGGQAGLCPLRYERKSILKLP